MKSLLKAVFVNVLSWLLILGGLGAAAAIALTVLTAVGVARSQREAAARPGTILSLDLSFQLTERPAGTDARETLSRALGGDGEKQASLYDVTSALRRAQADRGICALFVHGNLQGGGHASGFAAVKELREALAEFQASGKPVLGYLVAPSQLDYFLASACTNLILNPAGTVELAGLASEPIFLAGALEKYGIGIQVTRVGKYKSAIEPFITNRMSEASREQTLGLIDDLWTHFRQGVESSRRLEPGTVQRLADEKAVFTGTNAVAANLVDRTGHFSDALDLLRGWSAKHGGPAKGGLRQVDILEYIEARALREELTPEIPSSHVALVVAEGEIVDGDGGRGRIGGDSLARQLREIARGGKARALVLRVNSPGGSALASDIIGHEVSALRAAGIPVVVSMGSLAASGGYWIAADADRIFAEPNTITGSIGVFGLLPNVQKLAADHGITWDSVSTARFAGIRSLSRPKTDAELRLVQTEVDDIYERFLSRVAEARKMSRDAVHAVAQGRVWSGEDARANGLVDELGGLSSAIRFAGDRAGLGLSPRVVTYPRRKPFAEALTELLEGGERRPVATGDPVSTAISALDEELSWLRALNDPRSVYARLPFNLRVR